MAAPSWHPDPFGRHEHRFFDGERWTEQVADEGATATDPVTPTDEAPPPGEGPPPGPSDGVATPAAGKKRGALLLVGVGVVVALVVAAVAVLLLRDGGGDRGDGDFSFTVQDDEATVHEMNLNAGDLAVVRVEGAGVRAAFGTDEETFEKVVESEFLGDTGASDAVSEASDFYSDLATDIATDSAVQDLPGFNGVVVSSFFGDDDVQESSILVPVSGKYYVLLLSESGEEDVELQVRVQDNPDVESDLSTDDLTDLDSDVYTDFVTDVESEFSDDTGSTDDTGS